MKPIPVALLSDSPCTPSGLGRITRDLATRLYKSNLPIRVATVGFNGSGSRDLPFAQYQCGPYASSNDIPKALPGLVDWFSGEKGLLFTIFDIPRLESFRFSQMYGGDWARWLGQEKSPFYLAGYFPIDGHSPLGMTEQMGETLRAFDSVGAYGPYGRGVLERTLAGLTPPKPTHLWEAPHGIDTSVFKPLDRALGRMRLSRQVDSGLKDAEGQPIPRTICVAPEAKLLGIVGTNQMRKDWGSAFQLLQKLPEWKAWIHTDRLLNFWSIPDLVQQYGVEDRVFITKGLEDSTLAELYSSCDVTFGLGAGEGFGFPLAEAMACGVPSLHTDYAGGADLLPKEFLVDPLTLVPQGPYCIQRPILDVEGFAAKIREGLPPLDCQKWASDRYGWDGLWRTTWLPIWKDLIERFKEAK